jgi:hypothetical protein
MKKQTRMSFPFAALLLCLLAAGLSGCQAREQPAPSQSSVSSSGDAAAVDTTQPSDSGDADGDGLYIFLGGDDYTRYPAQADSTPEELVAGIEELTGWKLTLADEITDGKGGMTVSFAKDACLFVGPPEEQKEEFHVYDASQLTFAVLDSVQKTLQCWASPTNPDSVDIYFCMEGDVPLELDSLGVTLPMDQPYSHEGLQTLLSGESQ